ncbi:putative TIMEOUT/TIM-2 protein [Daphnia sinensis]|uniref:TIMEOUT/TIM-2 protein n=1 Tax=Daphnia sinensis TaxID=1820382 RepID=A0AAD5PNU1_9CRUS|nr:putative TIMEOUT/TIM-2 protein [Daphnia sinensis]
MVVGIAGHEPTNKEDGDEADSDGKEIEEEELAAERRSEKELHFDEFIRRFAHKNVVRTYCHLLRRYATNTTLTNHCLIKMLHRIAWDCKMPAMMFQLSLFKTFQKIMNDPLAKSDPTVKELYKFAIYIMRKFAETAEVNPKIFVELLFWKTASEAVEIEVGYGNVKDPSHSRAVWSEEQEDELERLYHEFRDVQDGEGDVVDRILANLINQNRNRRAVIKKMKEMGLIMDAKSLARTKRSVKIRPPKEWGDHEIVELRRIFEEVRSSSDPLGLLIDRLPIPRSKRRVRDKIMELGLVEDVKELRKKKIRSAKSAERKESDDRDQSDDEGPARLTDSESDEESESDADDESEGEAFKNKKHEKSKRPKQYGFAMKKTDYFSPEMLAAQLRQLVDDGRKEGLAWLAECLSEALEDRQDGECDEAIPLVPLTDCAIASMEDHTFLKFIAKLGLAPPANEQEQFWRIPSTLMAADLRSRIDFLQKGSVSDSEDGKIEQVEVDISGNAGAKRLADEAIALGAHKRRRIVDSESSSSDAEPQDVEQQEVADAAVVVVETSSTAASTTSRKRFAVLDSSSDSE